MEKERQREREKDREKGRKVVLSGENSAVISQVFWERNMRILLLPTLAL